MVSRDVVEAALKKYTGTIVCISHDRHFLNEITNMTYEISRMLEYSGNPAECGSEVVTYAGNYDYYIWKKQTFQSNSKIIIEEKPPELKKKSNYKEQKRIANRVRVLTRKLKETEELLENIKIELINPDIASDFEQIQDLLKQEKTTENNYFTFLEELEKLQ
jgi:ATP-binding cassette subfamily F protein 3